MTRTIRFHMPNRWCFYGLFLALAAPLPLWLLRGAGNTSSKRWFALAAPLPLAAMVTAMWLAAPEPNAYGY